MHLCVHICVQNNILLFALRGSTFGTSYAQAMAVVVAATTGEVRRVPDAVDGLFNASLVPRVIAAPSRRSPSFPSLAHGGGGGDQLFTRTSTHAPLVHTGYGGGGGGYESYDRGGNAACWMPLIWPF